MPGRQGLIRLFSYWELMSFSTGPGFRRPIDLAPARQVASSVTWNVNLLEYLDLTLLARRNSSSFSALVGSKPARGFERFRHHWIVAQFGAAGYCG